MLEVLRRVAFHGADAPVRPVEDVEDFRDPVDRGAAAERDALLDPQVRPILRRRDQRVARDDRAIRPEAGAPRRRADVAQVAAVTARQADAGAEVMEPAHLEAVANLPDAVEHRPVTLIVSRQTPFAAQILGRWKRY